ncbi:MAG TPA: diacylglycerol kinase family protein [Pyrinomonadaceae bacterium]|jgi:diacylglycerol kinase family enzyme
MKERPRLLVIINRAAARARRAWPVVLETLKQNSISFDAHQTTHAGDATGRTREALKGGYNLIAVIGGDGTLSEAAEGFYEFQNNEHQDEEHQRQRTLDDDEVALHHHSSDLPLPVSKDAALALLPAGTGDDFARGLLGRRAQTEEWTSMLVAHCLGQIERERTIDLIYGRASVSGKRRAGVDEGPRADGARLQEFISINATTLGIGAEVARRVGAQGEVMRRMSGEVRFMAAALGALAAWRERRVRVVFDEGEAFESLMNLLAVSNGIYAGGGMMFAPEARLDDGLMDVVMASGITRATILRELPRIRRGAHLSNPRVRLLKTRSLRIETFGPENALAVEADGNLRGHTPAEFRIMPKALRVVV